MAQNAVEKYTLQHLLECIVHNLGPQEAAESGIAKGLVSVDKEIMKYGLVHRRAKTAYKKDERFLVIVPGKLLLFKGMDIVGKHVRFVTSLLGASTRLVYGQLEFEVTVPDSKSLNLLTLSAEELTGWIGAIDKSSLFANEGPRDSGRQNLQGARADKRRDLAYRNQENPGYTGRRKSEPSSRDTRREDFGAATQERSHVNKLKEHDGGDQRQGNREYWNQERERDQRNQVHDGYNFRQDNDRRAMDISNEFGQTNESSMQFPRRSLEQGRERDQSKSFYNGRQDDRRLNAVSNYQELPETSAKPMRSPRKDYPDQRTMDNSQLNARCLNGEADKHAGLESRGRQDYGESNQRQGDFERHEERNAGKGVVYYAQSGFDRGNADYLPGNTRENKAWDDNYGPPVEAKNANKEHRMSKSRHQSSTRRASVSSPLNQQLPAQINPTDLISVNRRGSKEELDNMFFYMNLYRRGLIDSSTQT